MEIFVVFVEIAKTFKIAGRREGPKSYFMHTHAFYSFFNHLQKYMYVLNRLFENLKIYRFY